jgi:RNA polymerase sigma-70 factor (ECF subfamily)
LSVTQDDDEKIIERLQCGDSTAIDTFVERYKKPVFALIIRLVGDHHLAEDIFQDTWMNVIRHVKRYRGDSKVSTWLFQIALNRCRDVMRRRRRLHIPLEDAPPHADPNVPDEEQILRARAVKRIVHSLPYDLREVIVLKYYHDLMNDEIARIAGIPVGTVKSRLHRASNLIRMKWKQRYIR